LSGSLLELGLQLPLPPMQWLDRNPDCPLPVEQRQSHWFPYPLLGLPIDP
jgi:hypothetical protein